MAAAGGGDLAAAFKSFATKEGQSQATTKDVTRMLTDGKVIGKNCSSNNLDIAFSKCKTKGKTTLTFAQFEALLKEVSTAYGKDHKCTPEEGLVQIREKLAKAVPKGHGTTSTSKTGGVGKMTDTSQYTGAHKERFDEGGKGKGIEGRADVAKNTGYVGEYKNEGTHGKK